MNDLQTRLEMRAAAQNWVASIMQQYGVSAAIVEDALNYVQLSLKDIITQEMLQSVLAEKTPTEEGEDKDNGGDN